MTPFVPSTYLAYLVFIIGEYTHIARAACPPNWLTSGSDCDIVLTQNSSFAHALEARQLCQQEGADLSSFADFTRQSGVYSLLDAENPSPAYVYIGLTGLDVSGNYTWINNVTELTYNNFSDQYDAINPVHLADRCVALYSPDGTWANVSTGWARVPCCFDQGIKAVLCTKPDTDNVTISDDILGTVCGGACSTDWHYEDGQCYKAIALSDTANNTYEASQACHSHGAELADAGSDVALHNMAHVMDTIDANLRPVAAYVAIHNFTSDAQFTRLNNSSISVSANFISTNYDAMTELCMSLNATSKTWQTAEVTLQPVDCCADQNIDWALCQKPSSGSSTLMDAESNPFAVTCFGDINECSGDPCMNGATCTDKMLRYSCACPVGFTGADCQTEIDYCGGDPCQHGGNCTNEVGGYACACLHGYSGTDCETVVDQCVSQPCQNGAACADGDEHYNCTCILGYEGINCETDIDDCFNITCQNNGTCVDGVNEYSCDCPVQYTGPDCGTSIICNPAVPEVGNSTHKVIGGNYAGGQVVYTCSSGMKFPDMLSNKTITCLQTKSWDMAPADIGHCDRHCPPIPEVDNAVVDNPSTRIGSNINYTCAVGHLFPDNSSVANMSCLESGNWSLDTSEIPDCEIVKCPALPVWRYQELDMWNNTYDTTVTFWCDVGYELHDHTTARTIRCKADGDWTAPLPPCNPVRCPEINPPDSWHIMRNTDNNTYGTYVHYECEDDRRMLDGSTFRVIKCDATAEWSDNITNCTHTRCFPLPFVANATPSTLDAEFDTETWLSCIKGHRFYERYRKLLMRCKDDGWWTPILSSCEPIYCGEMPTVLNTQRSTESRLFSTVVDYQCDRGHYYYPNMTSVVAIECMDNEEWNTTDIDPCWPIVCDPPPGIVNGTRELPDNYNYSSIARYTCDDNFRFIDGQTERNIVCTELGVWNVTDVSCRVDRCTPVPMADSVVPNTRNTSWDTNVTYSCALGHEWPQNKSTHHITCVLGEWNDTNIPFCTIKECEPVMKMDNATWNDTIHVYNTIVQYDCDVGYKFEDNSTERARWCSHTALWEPKDFPLCQIIHCPDLEDVENATRNSNETFYNKHVHYDCDPGYQYPDKLKVKSVKCTENETWTEYPPPCEVVFCPPVPYWSHTNFNSTDNEFHAVVAYSCKEGYSFEDSLDIPDAIKISECIESKVWAPSIDDCLARESIIADLIGVTYESPDSISIGTIACAITCTVLGCVVLLDTKKIYSDLKMMKNNIESGLKSRKPNNKVSDRSTCIQQDMDP